MSLRRGFKAEANRTSVQVRTELKARPEDPLDLEGLARRLDIPIVPLSAFGVSHAAAVHQLCTADPKAFSAITLCFGGKQKIVLHNDVHSLYRQRSNIAHEFAHILLKHPMTVPFDPAGCRDVDPDLEEEATWLAGTLLVPDPAAVRIVRSGMDNSVACDTYGVSPDMLRFRVNASGARILVARWRRS